MDPNSCKCTLHGFHRKCVWFLGDQKYICGIGFWYIHNYHPRYVFIPAGHSGWQGVPQSLLPGSFLLEGYPVRTRTGVLLPWKGQGQGYSSSQIGPGLRYPAPQDMTCHGQYLPVVRPLQSRRRSFLLKNTFVVRFKFCHTILLSFPTEICQSRHWVHQRIFDVDFRWLAAKKWYEKPVSKKKLHNYIREIWPRLEVSPPTDFPNKGWILSMCSVRNLQITDVSLNQLQKYST